MLFLRSKIGVGIGVLIFGWLCTAGVRAIQTEYRVQEHEDHIRVLGEKINQISSDVSYVRGKLDSMDRK